MVCRLKDIADELGVSVNTVSRALKGKDGMSDSLCRTIRARAAELGYVPDLRASSLRTGQTKTVAIVYDNLFNPYFSVVTGILQNKLYAKNYNVLIFSDDRKMAILDAERVKHILSRGVDGIISFLEIADDALEILERTAKKYIVIGRSQPARPDCSLTADDEFGGYIAGKYLLDNGHTDVAVFSASLNISCAADRLAGFKRAFSERGRAFDEKRLFCMHRDGTTVKEFIERAERAADFNYTAIFCFNDMMAYATIERLNEMGKSVPGDVSVIGYDHIESRLILPVGLTTVDSHKEQLAATAAQRMTNMLEGGDEREEGIPKPVVITGKTVVSIS